MIKVYIGETAPCDLLPQYIGIDENFKMYVACLKLDQPPEGKE